MKLSVLIPTHNYKCYTLVADLHEQLEQSGVDYEIIVAEDGSKDQVSIISNHRIDELPHCRHIIRRENVGRARIRNFLVREAQGEWCILMDCDAKVVKADYIQTYINAMKAGNSVVSGDLVNPTTLPSPEVTLRYKYERSCEAWRSAEERNKHPHQSFTTFNLLARREVLLQVPFDERCTEYGYEDALMGLELKRHGIEVLHIDNQLMHMGFEPNHIYLNKVETSLRTLHKIHDSIGSETRITRLYCKLSGCHLVWAVVLTFKLIRPLLKWNLRGKHPNITLLSFYKLGYYCSL